jgi:hypothetical protein
MVCQLKQLLAGMTQNLARCTASQQAGTNRVSVYHLVANCISAVYFVFLKGKTCRFLAE